MIRALLSASVIWAVGCIIPAHLEPEPDNPPNSRPQVISAVPDFFGPVVLGHDEPRMLQVIARDGDVRDPLLGRLRGDDGTWLSDPKPAATVSDDGTERKVIFGPLQWCHFGPGGGSLPWSLQVFVSDTTFPPGEKELPSGERSDFKAWRFDCR